jgi:cation/acetate symporter
VTDGSGLSVLDKLDRTLVELGFAPYTDGSKATIDVFAITLALMVGTAGLPHVIVRFFTVPNVADARKSAGYALVFIALLYTTAPAVGCLRAAQLHRHRARRGLYGGGALVPELGERRPDRLGGQERRRRIQYAPGAPFAGPAPVRRRARGPHGERVVTNPPTDNANEVYVDRDIMVLANPEIANLPDWVVALVAAGGVAAALSTAAGLLLVISASVSHDLIKNTFARSITDRQELRYARIAAAVAIGIAGYLGINPPGFVAEVVAFAFGLAAASLFPAIVMGIFSRA